MHMLVFEHLLSNGWTALDLHLNLQLCDGCQIINKISWSNMLLILNKHLNLSSVDPRTNAKRTCGWQ